MANEGIRDGFLDCTASVGLRFHVLEAGNPSDPLILLLHGFPELAYSWRHMLTALASKGHHVVAFDQRGYGWTEGSPNSAYEQTNLRRDWSPLVYVRDALAVVAGLGHSKVKTLVGHDVGAAVAAMSALSRPDVFTSLVLMSHPFTSRPPFPAVRGQAANKSPPYNLHAELERLNPPRKHYGMANAAPSAVSDWENPVQGLEEFLRGYFYLKSADYPKNDPHPLKAQTAEELAQMPSYYVLPLNKKMSEAVQDDCQGHDLGVTASWLPDTDLAVFCEAWRKTGFQGALNFYRVPTDAETAQDLGLFAGAKIVVPTYFVSGEKDWGHYKDAGALDNMSRSCVDFRGVKLIPHAGHWPQQEQPEAVLKELLAFVEIVGHGQK